MKPKDDLYGLPDDMKDLERSIAHMVTFHRRIGRMWKAVRARHVDALPLNLVQHLDEIAGVMVCEGKGCRELVHGDWDFCRQHGEKRWRIALKPPRGRA